MILPAGSEAALHLIRDADEVDARPAARGAGDELTPAGAQAERPQNVLTGADLLHRIGRERDADGVADAALQQRADADRRFDEAHALRAGLRDAQVKRIIAARRRISS